MFQVSSWTWLVLLLFSSTVSPARICLFSVHVFHTPRTGFEPLVARLIEAGHNVTVYSTLELPPDFPKLHIQINPKPASDYLDSFYELVSPLEWRLEGKHSRIWDALPIVSLDICHLLLKHQQTRDWLRSATSERQEYDLFIVDAFWNECGIGFAHIFKAKYALMSLHTNLPVWIPDAFGIPVESSWIPDPQFDTSFPATILTRLRTTWRAIRWHIYRESFSFYQHRKLFTRTFEQEFPTFRELERNTSLVLANRHYSQEYARSVPPAIVSIGGVHIANHSANSLDKKLITFVRNSTEGFVIVNVGCSPDTVSKLSLDTLQTLISSFERSDFAKFVFIWDETRTIRESTNLMKNLPPNVYLVNKCSSSVYSLLAEPNVKALVTHGSLLDIQEAIYHAVPLLLLPVYLDHDTNAERIYRQGQGICLEVASLTQQEFRAALQNIVTNDSYKNAMSRASVAFRDRQSQPLDVATWWIEYLLRNSDTSRLKPEGIHQHWIVRRSLDFWLLCCGILIGISIVAITVVWTVLNYIITGTGTRQGARKVVKPD